MNTNRPWVVRWDIPLLLAMFYAAFVIAISLGWLTGD